MQVPGHILCLAWLTPNGLGALFKFPRSLSQGEILAPEHLKPCFIQTNLCQPSLELGAHGQTLKFTTCFILAQGQKSGYNYTPEFCFLCPTLT